MWLLLITAVFADTGDTGAWIDTGVTVEKVYTHDEGCGGDQAGVGLGLFVLFSLNRLRSRAG